MANISEFIKNNPKLAQDYAIETQEYLKENKIPLFKTRAELAAYLSANNLPADLNKLWAGIQIQETISTVAPQEPEVPVAPEGEAGVSNLANLVMLPLFFFGRKRPELMEDDPKFKKIEEGLKEEWLKNNPDKTLESSEWLDYRYGNPDNPGASTLHDDAEKAFRQKQPKKAAYYDKQAKKIFKNPDKDPAIVRARENIGDHIAARKAYFEKNGFEGNWDDFQKKIKDQEWDRFSKRYKTKAYKYREGLGKDFGEKLPDLDRALDRLEIKKQLEAYTARTGKEIKYVEKEKREAPRTSVEEATKRLEELLRRTEEKATTKVSTALSKESREALGRARIPFSKAGKYISSLGQKGMGFAGREVSTAAKAGFKGTEAGIRTGLQGARVVFTVGRAIAPLVANPVGATVLGIVIVVAFILFFGHGSPPFLTIGGGLGLGGPGGGSGGGSICSTGSLDYYIPFRDSSILPLDPDSVKQEILIRWPNAQLQYWDTIVSESQARGWNPTFVLTLWIEETGASNHTKIENGGGGISPVSKGHLGCAPWEDQTINDSLSCLFNGFDSYTNTQFEDLMCVYGGDSFRKAPCTFYIANPNFPGNIKNWYSKLVPSGNGALSPSKMCLASGPGGWPTDGYLTQGPLGAFDHARLNSTLGVEAIDVANALGPTVFSSFDGEVSAIHDCISDGDCSRGWGGYGNSIEIRSNEGFTVLYGHLSSFTVSLGQRVKAGEPIGFMGTTGVSTGIHLHWEFRNLKMEPPNIPEPIIPSNCELPSIPCSPAFIKPGKST